VAFALGLYLVPNSNVIQLMFFGLLNAAIVYFFVWGVAGIGERKTGRKVLAILMMMFLIGLTYQNREAVPSYISLSSISNVYVSENAYVANSSPPPSTTSPESTTITSFGIQTSTTTSQGGNIFGGIANFVSSAVQGYPSFNPANPEFSGGTANISYPSNYTVFAAYALSLINNDRAQNGVGPLSLGTIPSGQQHADSMIYFNYFEHTDNQGYTPQQRFEMLGGGNNLMGENQGMDYCTDSPASATQVYPASCNIQTIESGIANSEWQMMNNDVVCCNNGHRMNILDTSYTSVSIGISYSSSDSTIYFVEDFYGPCPTGYICTGA
jgi:uncharacterized protein YkwD